MIKWGSETLNVLSLSVVHSTAGETDKNIHPCNDWVVFCGCCSHCDSSSMQLTIRYLAAVPVVSWVSLMAAYSSFSTSSLSFCNTPLFLRITQTPQLCYSTSLRIPNSTLPLLWWLQSWLTLKWKKHNLAQIIKGFNNLHTHQLCYSTRL